LTFYANKLIVSAILSAKNPQDVNYLYVIPVDDTAANGYIVLCGCKSVSTLHTTPNWHNISNHSISAYSCSLFCICRSCTWRDTLYPSTPRRQVEPSSTCSLLYVRHLSHQMWKKASSKTTLQSSRVFTNLTCRSSKSLKR